MAGPELAGEPDDDDVISGFDGEDDERDEEEDFEVGTVDLGIEDDEDIVAGFDGVEDTDDSEDESTSSGSESGGGSHGDVAIESAIENGLAEVACVGLQGSERQQVRREMQAVASQFKVGYFGEKCVQKYLKTDLENIPPEYGLAATLIAFAAVAIYKRPDGEEKVMRAVATVRDRFSGGNEPENSAPDTTDENETPEDDDNE